MSSTDPGGGIPTISNLQESFNQQQAQISALKELVRNSDRGKNTASAQEKVKNIAQRLSHMKLKTSKSRVSVDRSFDSEDVDCSAALDSSRSSFTGPILNENESVPSTLRAKSEALGSEKIQLLREQMEKNRQKMAEREHNKRGIEEMVTQLKAKFDLTQMSLEKSSELGKSVGDLSLLTGKGSFNKSTSDLSYSTGNLDKERIRNLQKKIIDLEQKLKDKENHNPQSDSDYINKIKRLENKIIDLEENLKEKESVIEARTHAVSLMSENLSLKGKNTVDLLEETKQEMIKMQTNFIQSENEFKSEIEVLKIDLSEKKSVIENMNHKINILESARYDLTVKNSELENKLLDGQYSKSISDTSPSTCLEHQKYDIISEDEITEISKNDNVIECMKKIQTLEIEIEQLSSQLQLACLSDSEIMEKYKNLELENTVLKNQNNSLEESLTEKSIEYRVLQANFSVLEDNLKQSVPKSLFSKSTDEEAELEITKLKSQLDEANKSSIKMKLKMKQLQKQMDNFKKSSNLNNEVVQLTEENQTLQQKIIELEEEKGQLQLKLVNDERAVDQQTESDLENKLKILEHTCQNQTSAIQLLEEQKIDMTQDLSDTKNELVVLKDHLKELDQQETTRVTSHYNEIEYEENVEKYKNEIGELKSQIVHLESEVESLNEQNSRSNSKNIELISKIDKLTLQKGSSNESIEIVENLTQLEKEEIEQYEKLREKSKSAEEPAIQNLITEEENLEISDSLIKLQEESSELLHKINLFTTERCEVLEKIEKLSIENKELRQKLDQIMLENERLSKRDVALEYTFSEEERYITTLKHLENEIDLFKRINDKNVKTKSVKKLAVEAQKTAELLKLLINKHKEVLSNQSIIKFDLDENLRKLNNIKEVRVLETNDEIERLKSIILESSNAEIDKNNLTDQLKEIKLQLLEKEHKINTLEQQLINLNSLALEYEVKEKEFNRKLEEASKNYSNEITTQLNEIKNIKLENERTNQQLKESELRLNSTYEQIEILKSLVAEQKQQLIDSYTEHEKQIEEKNHTNLLLESKLQNLKIEKDQKQGNKNEIENLKVMLDQQEEDLHYKQETIETLNNQIMNLYQTMEENSNQMFQQQNELQEIIDGKDHEIKLLNNLVTESKTIINNLKVDLDEKLMEYNKLKNSNSLSLSTENTIKTLRNTVQELENKNKEQLEKLKKFAANLKKKVAQYNELENEFIDLTNNDLLLEQLKDAKHTNNELKQYSVALEEENRILKMEINKTNITLQESSSQEKTDNLIAQKEIEIKNQNQVIAELRHNIAELYTIIEKEKSEIARRDHALDLFEVESEKNRDLLQKKDKIINDNKITLESLNRQLAEITSDLNSKNVKIEKCKAIIKEKNNEIKRLKNECELLNLEIENLKLHFETNTKSMNEDNEQQIIERLNSKIQENSFYIETIQNEKSDLTEKIVKLEDGIRNIEERRMSLERHANILDHELREKTNEFSENEDMLVQRLTALSQHDEIMEKRLQEVQNENIELGELLKETKMEKDDFNKKIQNLQNHILFLEETKLPELQKSNTELVQALDNNKTEIKRLHSEFEKKLHEKNCEIDDIEINYTSTIDLIQKNKKEVEELNEKYRDEIDFLKNELLQVQETNNNLDMIREELDKELTYTKMQYESNQIEIHNLRQQVQLNLESYELEVNNLKQKLAELDSVKLQVGQNQTDDQVMLQHENRKLKEMLVEKEHELEILKNIEHSSYDTNKLQTIINEKESEIEELNNELKLVKRNMIRQTSYNEIENVLLTAEDHLRSLQKSPVLQNFNLDDIANARQKYESDLKNYKKNIEQLERELKEMQQRNSNVEERLKNMIILRDESIRQLVEKTDAYDRLKEIQKEYETKISSLENSKDLEAQIIPTQSIQSSTTVPSFDSSIFFGQSNTSSPFDEQIIVKNVPKSSGNDSENQIKHLTAELEENNIIKLKFEKEIQNLINDRENLLKDIHELKTLNESYLHTIKEFNNANNNLNPTKTFTNVSAFFDTPKAKTLFENVELIQSQDLEEELYRDKTAVVENIIIPKKSYLCHESDMKLKEVHEPINQMKILFDDQSWGWEAEPTSLDNFSTERDQEVYVGSMEELKNENKELQNVINEWQIKHEQFSSESEQNLQHINELKISNSKYLKEIENLQETIRSNIETVNQIDELKSCIDTLSKGNTDYQNQIVQQADQYKKQIDDLNALIIQNKNAFFIQNKNEQEQNKLLNEQFVALQFEYQNLQSNVAQLEEHKKQLEQVNKDLQDANQTINKYKIEINQLQSNKLHYDEALEQIEQYKRQIYQLNEENHEYHNQMQEINQQIDNLTVNNNEYQNKIVQLNQLNDQLNVTNLEYQMNITKLEETIQNTNNKIVTQEPVATSLNVASFFAGDTTDDPFGLEIVPKTREIVEELIQPKKAYVCGTLNASEGWGFDSNDDILEEQHQQIISTTHQMQSLVPPNLQTQIEIQEYQDKIQELELEKSRMEEEIISLKVKSGKLIKKLKEYKSKDVRRSQSVESSNDLDLAIQEELNNQLKNLENRLKEMKVEQDKSLCEKENLVKRVDILTSANDRMVEMKDRQDRDVELYQHKIKELNIKLKQLEEWDDENYNKFTPKKSIVNSDTLDPLMLQSTIDKLKLEINDLQVDNDELQAILEEEKSTNKSHEVKLQQLNEMSNRIEYLENELNQFEIKLKEKTDENNNLVNEIERIKAARSFQTEDVASTMAMQFNNNQSSTSTEISVLENEIQSLTGQLQYKDSEILHLNQKISDIIKEDQTQSLVQEILNKNHEIIILKQQTQELVEEKEDLENNLSLQLTKEEIIKLNKELEIKNNEISILKQDKIDMENELKILNEQVLASLDYEDKMKLIALEVDVKNIELKELKSSLDKLKPNADNDQKAITLLKPIDTVTLDKKEIEVDSEKVQDDESMLKKMHGILETQEIEIVTLKEQLAIRSAEYARLASKLDPYAQISTSSSTTLIKPPRKVSTTESNTSNSSDTYSQSSKVIPRAELDLALYMLHQRDMRCEELTFELVHLLEERDTLQLKLSNSIRYIEDIKQKGGVNDALDTKSGEPNISKTSTPDKSVLTFEGGTNETIASTSASELKSKLTELHGVDHARDKTLQEDRENRQRQMTQLQRDISNIPSEAVAQLVGVDYTLSRTSQSPSSVLLNWLMGKSTPKAPQ